MNKNYNSLEFLEAWSKLDTLNEAAGTAISSATGVEFRLPFKTTKVTELVYHGSNADADDIKEFDFEYKYGQKVFAWFTPNFKGAEDYALDGGGYVHSAFLNISNPLDLSHINLSENVFTFSGSEIRLSDESSKLAAVLKINPIEFFKHLKDLKAQIEKLDMLPIDIEEYYLFDYVKSPFFRADFEKYCSNNDGLICKDDQGISYAVCSNEQIYWLETIEVEDYFS